MSKSHLVNHDTGSLRINGDLYTSSSGNLLVNGNPFSASVSFEPNDNILGNLNNNNFSNINMGNIAFFVNSIGNLLSNTNLFYYDSYSPFGLGGTNGSLLISPSVESALYFGDDNITLVCGLGLGEGFYNYTTNSLQMSSSGTILSTYNYSVISQNFNLDIYGNTTIPNLNVSQLTPTYFIPHIDFLTQYSSSTSTVTSNNTQFGLITTYTSTLSAQNTLSFTVNNNNCDSQTPVLLNLTGYTGSHGLPTVYCSSVNSNSFNVTIQNNSTTQALNGTLNISYTIMNVQNTF